MHTLQIKVSDNLYNDVISYLSKYPKSELKIKKTTPYPKDILVSSVEEVRRRVHEAEARVANGEYLTQEEFEKQMDNFFENELGIKR